MTKKELRISLCWTNTHQILAHGSISERYPCCIQSTPQHNSLKTRITTKLATAFLISVLQTQHILLSYVTKLFVRRQMQ